MDYFDAMMEKNTNKQSNNAAQREKRRAEQLRANLMRRKTQAKARRSGEADERTDGITAKGLSDENLES